jgi:hypothetical protein
MAGHAHTDDDHTHGEMDIADQRQVFDWFMVATVWGCLLTAMVVAAATGAFALGWGGLAGVAIWAALGIAGGFALKRGAPWYALVIVSTVILGLVAVIGAILG